MRRHFLLSFFALVLGTVSCGGDDDGGTDAGTRDDSGMVDSGPVGTDSGPDVDAGGEDAGPMGCTEGCAIVELSMGGSFTCARRENGEIMCWGDNEEGQVGDGGSGVPNCGRHLVICDVTDTLEFEDCAPPTPVNIIDDATQLSSRGMLSICALRESDDEVWCWGLTGISDMKGSDTLPKRCEPEVLPGFTGATVVADAWGHTCALVGGAVKCYGNNDRGQLGIGDTQDQRTVVDVTGLTGTFVDVQAAGFHVAAHTCAMNDAGEIWCWGNNDAFQMGDGDVTHDNCSTMGGMRRDCALTPVQVLVPMGVTPVQMSMGPRHGCFLDDAGAVYCWGENAFGQLGLGDSDIYREPQLVPGLGTVVEVKVGSRATCAREDTGQVWCWGGNEFGTIGDGLDTHGETCGAGSSLVDCATSPQQVSGLDDATLLDLGSRHACVVRTSGEVWCWGNNTSNQLSQGDIEPRNTPVLVMGLD